MERLDRFLAHQNYSVSRERARREILAGWVKINGETCRTVSQKITGTEEITVSRPGGEYVSRGGYKLEKALEIWDIDVAGQTVADLGASTGGFTDCLLKRGAAHVYAIDVGYGQLAYSLRTDERVTVMERTHVRDLTGDMFDTPIDFITGDLSFISLTRIFPVCVQLFRGIHGIVLLKPQFEALQSEQKKGVVKDKNIHCVILGRVVENLAAQGMKIHHLAFSPITGPKGNREFLLFFSVCDTPQKPPKSAAIIETVEAAWLEAK